MNRLFPVYIIACIIMLASCATGKRAAPYSATASKSGGPRFMDSVDIKGHNTQHVTAGAGQRSRSAINRVSPSDNQSLDVKRTEPEEQKFITYTNTDEPTEASEPRPRPAKRGRHRRRRAHKTEEEKPVVTQSAKTTNIIMPGAETDSLLVKYAHIIAMNPNDMNNPMLYHFVDEWYGTAYKWGGSDLDGVDCSGFSQQLYEHIYNVDLPRTVNEQRHSCDRTRHMEEAEQGDLVFFRIRKFRVSHVGVYLANGYFVHASSSHGVTISNINEHYWHKRFAGRGRIEKSNGLNESEFIP